ncbi:hypothetical protein K437DRAFT_253449 [Tilletiaria anomala UBC 951]|uniref:Uncharacterized protein n=1 Tax=Tilletiaria anomala (strain ATCC 24038 / CBS 436.72 / UBC 951) TaxID=1037660 RepID=A0A066WH24_TILAU|nr:uncharacterized protein K437DRAFT_253449 [Tilletiaria anomala UBC 951]KDN53126.1 hypothetical protein K437DRAFT_253449 [Tilletiaria anomala UBC 951]
MHCRRLWPLGPDPLQDGAVVKAESARSKQPRRNENEKNRKKNSIACNYFIEQRGTKFGSSTHSLHLSFAELRLQSIREAQDMHDVQPCRGMGPTIGTSTNVSPLPTHAQLCYMHLHAPETCIDLAIILAFVVCLCTSRDWSTVSADGGKE